jgi:sulfate permease, SulP family
VSEERRSGRWVGSLIAGLMIGAVETVVAAGLAVIVFSGRIVDSLPDGVMLYLGAAALVLTVFAWRAGPRGVVGGLQEPIAAVLTIVAAGTALNAYGGPERGFLSVVASTLVVTILVGIAFIVLGRSKRANLIRFVPYPVVGGFLAGVGWLLVKGGILAAGGVAPALETLGDLTEWFAMQRWLPALAFGLVMLAAVRIVKWPFVIPVMLLVGVVAFAIGVLVTGSTIDLARGGGWLLYGPFDDPTAWEPWTQHALTGADWSSVAGQWASILAAVFVAVLAILFNVSGSELLLRRDLDTNEELRDAGVANLLVGAFGGPPGYHALSLTALAEGMRVNARVAGLIAAAVPLAGVVVGVSVIELIPRMIVGGVLVFVGLSFIVEWVWDRRRSLQPVEFGVVLLILLTIAARGFLPGVVVGLVLAVVLFAVSYGRVELVREVPFGGPYRSNVDRPPADRAALSTMGGRVQILRVTGFVFFGSANSLLERIRKRVEEGGMRFLVIDLRRVTGVDSSAVVSFVKVIHLAESHGFELVFTGAREQVRRQLGRGGVDEVEGLVWFEPDLDRGLQRCEDRLLADAAAPIDPVRAPSDRDGHVAMPRGLAPYLERIELDEGRVLIQQNDVPDDVFILESGGLRIETETADGTRLRLSTLRPGVVVGEVALYTGAPRTADVVTETHSVVQRLSAATISRIETEDPALATELHRWLASILSERLSDTMREFDALMS